MNIEELRAYCLSKKGVTEDLPFGPDTLVFKVKDKIFLLTGMDHPLQFNVKCDPERAIELRDTYTSVKPGYHMNKKYWNTITIDGSVAEKRLQEWITHSYDLVVAGLPKNKQKELQIEGEK
ncbi:MAG TPA: MmcQ/YjbR family DNA-binding protein [Bacteroidia bacterium]|jgi:predicted DNA-binding protein (MmcQ/YjbR family)|nr:MmcQ/YjbR family DNA-binding protein [Bacteroidia bacterium]